MFRRNKIDVVATLRLKLKHHAGYCLRRTTRNGWSRRYSLADVVVLAKDTSKIAVRKEDCARTVPTTKAILLAKMREITIYDCITAGLARSPSVLEAVHTAIARTHAA